MRNYILFSFLFCCYSFAYAQTSVIIAKNNSIYSFNYFDDLNELTSSVFSGLLEDKQGKKYDIYHNYPTLIYPRYTSLGRPILIFPNDSIVLDVKDDKVVCIYPNDSLRNVLAVLDRQYGNEIQVSGYSIKDMQKSEHIMIINGIKSKMRRQVDTVRKYQSSLDTVLYKSTIQEIKSLALSSILVPFVDGDTDWKKFPEWYIDSVRLFKEEIYGTDTLIKGAQYRQALYSYNQFLCRDSLTDANRFYVQFNSALSNFKGQHRDFLMAYLLRKFKIENVPNYYDYVGIFYAVCQDEVFLKYVKQKLDDTDFSFPEYVLNQKLKHENGQSVTWRDLLEQHKGKMIYLEFSASWCPPCIYMVPFVIDHAKALKDKPIVFITISVDKSEKAWKKAVNKYHISGDGVTTYWLGEKPKFTSFLFTRREKEKSTLEIPRFMYFDHKGHFITSKAMQPLNKPSRKQIELFLKDMPLSN
ncbi:redoxin family protein [Emticicia sp. ODNR4P]|jgi:thiol-disulfide isomerase/thioredoxin|nr:redoxin family protein [Emticicia sp. ODNR4P]